MLSYNEFVIEESELQELNTNQLIKKLAADIIFKKKYTAAVAKVKEIMFKHGPKPRHGKEYYAGKIALQMGLDPHVLAVLVDEQVSEASETWDDGYKRRVVKTTKSEHKDAGYE